VRKVELQGVERFEDDELTAYLNLRPTSPFAFGGRSYFVPGLEAVDRRRVEAVYAAHGYPDAKVTRFDVQIRHPERKVKRQRAYVTIAVDEGQPTTIRAVRLRWVEPVHASIARSEIEAAARLAPNDQFSIPSIEEAATRVEDGLAAQGFAFAEVEESARVDPVAHRADVALRIDPGPRKRVSAVQIDGLDRIPADLVQREADFAVGARYSPGLLRDLERKVYAMGVFSAVTVSKGERDDSPDLVVRVRVQENQLQRVKFGVGLGIDPVRWDQHVSALYRHDNLFGRLYGFTARATVGYAELPALYQPQQHGPVASLDLELRKKGLLERNLVWTEAPRVELGLWDGYQFYSVANRIGVSRFFTRFFELGLSYNNRFTDLFNISPTLDRNRTVLGLDFRDPYFLAFVQVSPTVHLTDDLLSPHNGVRISANYDLASTYLGGQFDYHKIEPDFRAYYRPHDRIQFALRSRVAMIFPYGLNPGAPIDLKLYLGGSGDVRGWGLRRLSPRVTLCPAGSTTDCDVVPTGGKSLLHGTFEFRVRTWRQLWVAAFTDAGDVRDGIAAFDLDGLMYSTGGGLRYDTDFGIFRLDVGVRLNDDPRFVEPRRWAIHFGVGEVF
jgi:outer membrane protein assembly factor BamA